MKRITTLAAVLGLLGLLALLVATPRYRPESPAAPERHRVVPVVASLSEIGPAPAVARPDREDEGDSRIESSYSEAEITILLVRSPFSHDS